MLAEKYWEEKAKNEIIQNFNENIISEDKKSNNSDGIESRRRRHKKEKDKEKGGLFSSLICH